MTRMQLISNARVGMGWALVAGCLLLAGCGEFSYKRGANAGDLAQAKQECESSAAPAVMAACLESKGWLVGNFDQATALDEEDPVVQATYQDDPRGPAADSKPEETPTPATTASPEKNPLDVFHVSSWWKAGQGAAALHADAAACVADLGEAHRPDPSYQKVTRGLLHCMRGRGWYALQAH